MCPFKETRMRYKTGTHLKVCVVVVNLGHVLVRVTSTLMSTATLLWSGNRSIANRFCVNAIFLV